MHAFKSQAAGIRPITIEDCNDSPSWDRGAQPGSGSVDYPEGGCRVSGGGYYRIGAQADSALWEWGRARRGEAQGEGGVPFSCCPSFDRFRVQFVTRAGTGAGTGTWQAGTSRPTGPP